MSAWVALAGMLAVCFTALAILFCLSSLPQLATPGNRLPARVAWAVVLAVIFWSIWAVLNFYGRQGEFQELTRRHSTPADLFKSSSKESRVSQADLDAIRTVARSDKSIVSWRSKSTTKET